MALRNDSLDTALLLMEILKRIPRQRRITAADLQKQLAAHGYDRNIRTIQRHLDTLSTAFGLERDERSKPFGYCWREQAPALSLPSLTAQEALLLQLAHGHLQALLPPRLLRSMEPYFEQAGRNLDASAHSGDAQARSARQWLRKVRVVPTSQPLLPPKIDAEVFEEVTTALQDNRWLQVQYRNATQQERDACVMPLGLVQQGTSLYLVCRFEGYHNERNLALHRMAAAQAQLRSFSYPDDFDLARYEADGRFGYGDGERIRLRFCIDKQAGLHLTEARLSEDQRVQEHAEHYTIKATVVDSAMLTWWLRGFGEDVWNVRRKAVQQTPKTPAAASYPAI
ncbi:helix-turn-helix transcriptional regulator [Simplicispira psychrophila]|uniref:helix-turn-helix transcriptional regulator n=1 Tax=Simplicispira psychrophila TaxID=80882 RepID=UPI0004889CC9|nr:WYL domain-containing protein [Simplicispira psychrophila]